MVTRPRRQAGKLASLIEAEGGRALQYPAIEIRPADSRALRATLENLDAFSLAIFISQNAVEQGLERARALRPWPAALAVAAVGSGTRRALQAAGFPQVIAPEGRGDSEALLACAELSSVAGKRIVIFRGLGGREVLATTLRERGATVVYAECYSRERPATDMTPLLAEWARGAVDAVTVSSAEGLANLAGLLGEAGSRYLAETPLFVPHERVAGQARGMAVMRVEVAGASDEEVLAALVAYFGGSG